MKYSCLISIAAAMLIMSFAEGNQAQAKEIIKADATWQEDREITGDLIIPDGITLTIGQGVTVRFHKKPGSDALPKILVHGHFEAEGDEGNPVVFSAADGEKGAGWAGIIIDDGNAWFREAQIRNAHTAVHVKKGWVKLKNSVLQHNSCGVIIQGESCGIKIEKSIITNNEYGLIIGNDSVVSLPESSIQGNTGKDILSGPEASDIPETCVIIPDKDTLSK